MVYCLLSPKAFFCRKPDHDDDDNDDDDDSTNQIEPKSILEVKSDKNDFVWMIKVRLMVTQ